MTSWERMHRCRKYQYAATAHRLPQTLSFPQSAGNPAGSQGRSLPEVPSAWALATSHGRESGVEFPGFGGQREDVRLLRLIRASFVASHGIYGAPRVFLDLREARETCSKHRVARLMRQAGLRALHGYRTRWAVGKPSVLIPNVLQRQFTVTRRNKVWVTDITYIRTWQGWLYLAVVIDLFSRTIIHSDQGTQFGSDAWNSSPQPPRRSGSRPVRGSS